MKKNNSGFGTLQIKCIERKKYKFITGFTLVEMLIVAAIISIVSLAIYSALNNGIMVWQRTNGPLPMEEMVIFLNKFSRDLKNTFKFEGLEFEGEEDRLEFASLITSQLMQKTTVGKVLYLYNAQAETLTRVEKDFSEIYTDGKGKTTPPLRNIKDLKLQYYYFNNEKKEYMWDDNWRKEQFPLAVRLELEIKNGNEVDKIVKTVSLPLGALS